MKEKLIVVQLIGGEIEAIRPSVVERITAAGNAGKKTAVLHLREQPGIGEDRLYTKMPFKKALKEFTDWADETPEEGP